MRKATLAVLAAALVTGTVWSPATAAADGRQGFRGPSHHHHHRDRLHFVPPKRFESSHRFQHKHHGHHGGVAVGIVAPPTIIYSAPAYVPQPPVYAPSPVYVPAPPAYAPPVSIAPTPRETVIEFPNGRYELRGDGITTPYRWVWVPNPPTAPPAEVTPDRAPLSSIPEPPAPARSLDVYRWTDEAGVVHLTDRLDKVPEAYREKVTKFVKGHQ